MKTVKRVSRGSIKNAIKRMQESNSILVRFYHRDAHSLMLFLYKREGIYELRRYYGGKVVSVINESSKDQAIYLFKVQRAFLINTYYKDVKVSYKGLRVVQS